MFRGYLHGKPLKFPYHNVRALKKALTRRIARKGSRGKQQVILIPPSERLVLGVKFTIVMIICLSILEIAHMDFLKCWSPEVFAGISDLVGTVSGVLIEQRV